MKREPLPLPATEDRGVLRFLTCGSVDDGKSTLIGRLLFDSKTLLADTLAAMEQHARKRGLSAPDLSLLTDGLIAEREQGITIDVAYRYFATARRKFIIADAPGHEQYTRNMVTAASTADVAVLLVDARKGVIAQTRRHATLAALLGIRQVLVAVNKMDLVNYDPACFAAIAGDFTRWLDQHSDHAVDIRCVPLSALQGDMVVERGENLDWYNGPTLLDLLEAAPSAQLDAVAPLRLPVQWIARGGANGNGATTAETRGYAGRIEAGQLSVGDDVTVLPSGLRSRVTRIALGEAQLSVAVAGQSVTISLADERDISRGDMIIRSDQAAPVARTQVTATLCWLSGSPLSTARNYVLQHTTRSLKARVQSVAAHLDIQSLSWIDGAAPVALNDITRVQLRLQQPLAIDDYRRQRATGSFILIDEASNDTVAAGLIEAAGPAQ